MSLNNETYFEFDEELDTGFTTIPNYILNDTNLTYKAVGVYVQILQYRNTGKHKVYLKSLANYRKDRKTAVSTALKELEEHGYITRHYIRNEKGHIKGIKYIVRMKPIVQTIENTTLQPKAENLTSDNLTSENTTLKIKYNKNKINKKENIDVDDAPEKTHQEKVIDLYKSFKLERRVMPHTLKLLNKYSEYFNLDVFEYIFIQASEDSVDKKYNYIKTLLEDYFDNKVFTMNDLTQYNQKYKESNKKTKSTTKKESKQVKTRFHNVNDHTKNYMPDELEKLLKENQDTKFLKESENDTNELPEEISVTKELIDKCINSISFFNSLDINIKYSVRDYILNSGGFMPLHIRNID